MVIPGILAAILITGSAVAGRTASKPRVELCFGTVAAFGQNLQTLYCNADSCYLMVYAAGHKGASGAGLFAAPVERDTLAKGDSLTRTWADSKPIPMASRANSFWVRRNGSGFSIPGGPEASPFPGALKGWVQNRKEEARSRALWTDSLMLSLAKPGSREASLRLASGKSNHAIFGRPVHLRVFQSSADSRYSETPETRVELPEESAKALISGATVSYRIPAGVDTLQAVFKIDSGRESPPLPNACMEGQFELVSRPLVIKSGPPR